MEEAVTVSNQPTLDYRIKRVSERLATHKKQEAWLQEKVANNNEDDTRRDVWETNLLILARNIKSCTAQLAYLKALTEEDGSVKTPNTTEGKLAEVEEALDKCLGEQHILVEQYGGLDRVDDPIRFDYLEGLLNDLSEEIESLKERKASLEEIISFNKSEIVSNELADNPTEVRLGMLKVAKEQLIVARAEFYKHIDQVNLQIEKIENAERELEEQRPAKVIDISTRSEVDQSMSRHPAGSKQRKR